MSCCGDRLPAGGGVGQEPFRLTAWFGPHNPGRDPGPPGAKHTDYTAIDVNEGGTAIPYWMEDPYIAREYTETLKRNGAANRMDPPAGVNLTAFERRLSRT